MKRMVLIALFAAVLTSARATNNWEVATNITNVVVYPASQASTNITVINAVGVKYMLLTPAGDTLSVMLGSEWKDSTGKIIKQVRTTYEGSERDSILASNGTSVAELRALMLNMALKESKK